MEQTLEGKVCLVTGATRGLGQAAALELARRGAEVLIIGRNRTRIQNTLALLRDEAHNANVRGFQADLSSQTEVLRVAHEVLSWYSSLDVLINNVGATLLTYRRSPDGIEMTWALNYLNHFLLTHLMLDALKSAAVQHGEARVLEITSSVYRMSENDFTRLEKEEGYNGVRAYALSKRAMIMYASELARRMAGTGVALNAVTPGVVKTEIAGDNGWLAGLAMRVINRFAQPLEQGIQPIIHLATSPEMRGISGRYFYQYNSLTLGADLTDEASLRQLWQTSETMLGDHLPEKYRASVS